MFQIPFCCKPQSLGSLHIQDKDRYLSDGDGLAASGGFFLSSGHKESNAVPWAVIIEKASLRLVLILRCGLSNIY